MVTQPKRPFAQVKAWLAELQVLAGDIARAIRAQEGAGVTHLRGAPEPASGDRADHFGAGRGLVDLARALEHLGLIIDLLFGLERTISPAYHFLHDEWLENLIGHFFWNANLVTAKMGIEDDRGAANQILPALHHLVLEEPLFCLLTFSAADLTAAVTAGAEATARALAPMLAATVQQAVTAAGAPATEALEVHVGRIRARDLGGYRPDRLAPTPGDGAPTSRFTARVTSLVDSADAGIGLWPVARSSQSERRRDKRKTALLSGYERRPNLRVCLWPHISAVNLDNHPDVQ